MTEEQKKILQRTWNSLIPVSDRLARTFYERLFQKNPEFRSLFPNDMTEQWRKLMLTVGVAIAGLDNLNDIVPAVQAMGRRHMGYGVQPKDYAPTGAALLWALEKTLGRDWTPPVQQAWTEVYTILADTMVAATES